MSKILIIFLLILIISNIYNLVLAINVRKNSIIVEATVYDVTVNMGYEIKKRSSREYVKDYNIYIEYNVNGQNYKGVLNNYNHFHKIGNKINVYCDSNNYNVVTNENEIGRYIVFIVLLVIFFIIIKFIFL